MDAEFYRNKLVLSDHLETETYSVVPSNADEKVFKNLKKLVDKYKSCFTSKEIDFMINSDWKTSNFYVLPKIHKNKEIIERFKVSNSNYVQMNVPMDLKGRPITAGPNSPNERPQ